MMELLTASDKVYLSTEIEHCTIIDKAGRDARLQVMNQQFPHCIKFRNENVLGQKIIDLLVLGEEVLFIDSDVLFLKNFRLPGFHLPTFIKDTQNAYVFHPLRQQEKFKVFPKVNTGFFYFPFVSNALDKLEEQLANKNIFKDIKRLPCWAEQSLWALLAGFFNTIDYFSEKEIAMPGKQINENIPVAIHLVSTYRNRIDYYKQHIRANTDKPVTLSLVCANNKLSLLEYRFERIQKRMARFL